MASDSNNSPAENNADEPAVIADNLVVVPTPVQDEFLQEMMDTKTVVSIHLVNSIRLHGTVLKFDKVSVLFTVTDSKPASPNSVYGKQLVYKTNISTIVPSDPQATPRRRQ